MSIVQTTGGIFSTNGNLNVQGNISASAFSYVDSSGINHDITTAIENVATNQSTVANIISGSQAVGLATNANNLALTNVDTSTELHYLNFGSSSASGIQSISTSSKFNVEPQDGILMAQGGLFSFGFVNSKSAVFASNAVTISTSGAILVSASGSLNGANVTQLNYLSNINGGIVDLSSAQTISGIKTFNSACVFSGGFSTTSETDLGTLSVGGLISANAGLTLASNQLLTIPAGTGSFFGLNCNAYANFNNLTSNMITF